MIDYTQVSVQMCFDRGNLLKDQYRQEAKSIAAEFAAIDTPTTQNIAEQRQKPADLQAKIMYLEGAENELRSFVDLSFPELIQ